VAVLTALDRIEGLSHFPSDVLASIVIGTLVGRFVLLKIPYPWSSRYAGEKGEVCG
jgi:membrane-associated phospholipid phosphatase